MNLNRDIRDIESEPARRPRFPVERRLRRLILPEISPPSEARGNPFGTAFSAGGQPHRYFDKSAQK